MEVIWSSKARMTYFGILDYLEKNWAKKEIVQFIQKTEIVVRAIKRNPEIFPRSLKQTEIRKAIVDKNNSIFYQIDEKKIYLLTFFDNRQNPDSLKLSKHP